ncbi:MAG: uroporphyrinogen decarboxylase [Parvularculaceae bacterium]
MDTALSPFLRTLRGDQSSTPPIWLMRQAGRYLPEYRALREKAGSFLDLCYAPEMASEVTIQPIRRYRFDAAILFADILLLPHALGQNLSFEAGEGPKLEPTLSPEVLNNLRPDRIHDMLAAVYETVRLTRTALPPATALIGFAGAPWTVATYMIAGRGGGDPSALRRLFYSADDRAFLANVLELLTDTTIEYLNRQIEAGAQAVQLFDTWAGGLPTDFLRFVSIDPLRRVAEGVKRGHPEVPIILFAKGVGPMAREYAALDVCDAVGIDFAMPWSWARENLSQHAVVQGGLDPMAIVAGGEIMETAARELVRTFEGTPYIFNAGHGLTPDTPPENVGRLVDVVRGRA